MKINKALPRSTPESQGISSEAILSFLNAIEDNKLELHSFMLVRHGQVVSEGWWHPYSAMRPHMLFSLSKSFTSTAIGFAVDEGLLSVEDKVISFFPQELPEKVCDNLANMKVKHLLSMSTGHDKDASEPTFESEDGNWVKSFLSLEVKHEPGTHFVYNTAATYMLSAIIQKITGITLLEYLTPRLFEPLGIEDATWDKCPRGINTGGFGLSLKTEDIAKFGQLYLQKGQWEGKQLISSSWIEEATRSHISNGDNPLNDWSQGYGYQFWRCRHNAYRGDGAFGQYCVVLPEQKAVIGITSGLDDMQAVLNHIWEILLPAMSPSSLPENQSSQAKLKGKLQELNLPIITGIDYNPLSKVINNKRYVLEKNDINLQTVSFQFDEDGCNLIITHSNGDEIIKSSNKGYKEGIANLTGYPSVVASCGSWQDEHNFLMLVRLVETPFCYKINFKFEDDIVELDISTNVSFGPKDFPAIVGKIEI